MPKRTEHRTPTLPLGDDDRGMAQPPHAPPAFAADAEPEPDSGDGSIARFEQDMQELETIVTQMEQGELRLEDALKLFERGMALSRTCRRSLDQAELKVRSLSEADAVASSP